MVFVFSSSDLAAWKSRAFKVHTNQGEQVGKPSSGQIGKQMGDQQIAMNKMQRIRCGESMTSQRNGGKLSTLGSRNIFVVTSPGGEEIAVQK
jgi:hypothetical protein